MKCVTSYLIGIDEVGRGPIAGSVAVGAFLVKGRLPKAFLKVKDSKQLSPEQREVWFEKIEAEIARTGSMYFHVSFQSQKIIDKKGISYAIRTALALAVENVSKKIHSFNPNTCEVLLDGGLRAPDHFKNQKTIIRGDASEPVIALASICAKVIRDRQMRALSKKYPHHGFEKHKGYGTKAHYAAIKKHGLTVLHRRSFLKRFLARKKLAKKSKMR
jgi:ribonuclease HII